MRWLKITGLGVTSWALSLIWPELNRIMTDQTMLLTVLGLATLMLAYLLWGPRDQALLPTYHSPHPQRRGRDLSDSHPVKPLKMV